MEKLKMYGSVDDTLRRWQELINRNFEKITTKDVPVYVVGSLPTASVLYRHRIYTVEGSTSTADAHYVCKKLADNTYSWVQFDT